MVGTGVLTWYDAPEGDMLVHFANRINDVNVLFYHSIHDMVIFELSTKPEWNGATFKYCSRNHRRCTLVSACMKEIIKS